VELEGLRGSENLVLLWEGFDGAKCWCYRIIWRAAWEACSTTWSFGYQLSIRSRTKENHEKLWSSWPVAGPSGCKLSSSQPSGIWCASPGIVVPCVCAAPLLSKNVYKKFYKEMFVYKFCLQILVASRLVLLVTSRHGPHRNHRSQQFFYGFVS
jgi:hypothetical protein